MCPKEAYSRSNLWEDSDVVYLHAGGCGSGGAEGATDSASEGQAQLLQSTVVMKSCLRGAVWFSYRASADLMFVLQGLHGDCEGLDEVRTSLQVKTSFDEALQVSTVCTSFAAALLLVRAVSSSASLIPPTLFLLFTQPKGSKQHYGTCIGPKLVIW